MLKTIKGMAIGASVVAGVSAISAPAIAATFTPAGDITVFQESNGITQQIYTGDAANYPGTVALETILSGTSTASGGNVELQNNTDNLTLQQFAIAPTASLNADFGDGTSITFSSLTGSDWFGGSSPTFGANDFANEWFNALLDVHGATIRAAAGTQGINNDAGIFNAMLAYNVFQRFSDPNIAYVEKNNGLITFGLAGHEHAGNFFNDGNPLKPLFSLLTASEVVKASYNGAAPVYMYSFAQPFDSGVVNGTDGFSHKGTFEFTVSVPEPSAVLGLIAVGSLLTVCKRKSRKA